MLATGVRFVAKAVLFLFTFYFIMATSLLAEDIAFRRIIGFSADGNYFAFEQSGVLNGSGEAYSDIFLIDTRKNSWVDGSPFRARGGRGPDGVRRVRHEARQKARPALREYGIREKGVVLASNPITELSALPNRVTVASHRALNALDRALVFSIDEVDVPTSRCRAYTGKPVKGLVIRVRRDNGRDEVLHEDDRIPQSRGCPTSYRIEDVVRLNKRGGGAVYVVIYSFISSGAHGEELRYIAGGWHDEQGSYADDDRDRDMYDYSGRPDYADEADDGMDNFDDRDYDRGRWRRERDFDRR